jgi:hypothetical protein
MCERNKEAKQKEEIMFYTVYSQVSGITKHASSLCVLMCVYQEQLIQKIYTLMGNM